MLLFHYFFHRVSGTVNMTLYVEMALPDSQRYPEAEFKEFKPRIKFEMPLKYGLFRLKLYSMFQDLSRRSIKTGFWWIWDGTQIH